MPITENQKYGNNDYSCCYKHSDSISENNSFDNDSIEMNVSAQENNNSVFQKNNEIEFGLNLPKREKVDLTFKELRYTVSKLSFSSKKIGYVEKEILHRLNGVFKSGELTAIMGPSGAGKSTLLNIMAGYVSSGVKGTIYVNGKARHNNSESFRKLSCYIHQDDAPREYLTVKETMLVATHLKLGYDISTIKKIKLIKKILAVLGLDHCFNTYAGRLSGGQKKRLAIALELISNPPVLFLDEPTSGLDSASCTQCITLLQKLAKDGRTVICTIHQPSALTFEKFDSLYALSDGLCIYQGRIKELIPFLSDLGLHCPPYHNPADFLIDVAFGEYNSDLHQMAEAAAIKFNQRETDYDYGNIKHNNNFLQNNNDLENATTNRNQEHEYSNSINNNLGNQLELKSCLIQNKSNPANLFMQCFLLYKRNLVSSQRNYFLVLARITAHVLIGLMFGFLYSNVGIKANTVLANYVYLYGSILLLVYTGKMSVMMSFPTEMEMLAREHFNRWYKLGPYYLSIILFEIPFQMFCAALYIMISYWLTGNFIDCSRFLYFLAMSLSTTLCAQGWGFLFGASMPIKMAVFCGPVFAVSLSIFGFCTRYIDIIVAFRWMWHISYYRAGFHSVINSVYGQERAYLECPESQLYCHFRDPKVFLKEMMIDDFNIFDNIILLSAVFILTHSATIIVLWFKLNKR